MNIKELASLAGVSPTTVSLVLNKRDVKVAKETRERIERLAKEHHYRPSSLAVGLVTKKTRTVGLVIPDVGNLFFSEIAKNVEQELAKYGYGVVICNTNDRFESEQRMIDFLISRGVDGIILVLSADAIAGENERCVSHVEGIKIPIIALDRWVEGLACPHVSIDHRFGGELATRRLIDAGHRRIGCLTGPLNEFSAKKRKQGYVDALQKAGIPYDEELVVESNYTFLGGYEHAKELLGKDLSAVFACNDLMAYGLFRAAREMGKRIPEDISVIGFDDLTFSEMLEVPLTSVHQPIEGLCKSAVEKLLQRITSPQEQVLDEVIAPSVTERLSIKG